MLAGLPPALVPRLLRPGCDQHSFARAALLSTASLEQHRRGPGLSAGCPSLPAALLLTRILTDLAPTARPQHSEYPDSPRLELDHPEHLAALLTALGAPRAAQAVRAATRPDRAPRPPAATPRASREATGPARPPRPPATRPPPRPRWLSAPISCPPCYSRPDGCASPTRRPASASSARWPTRRAATTPSPDGYAASWPTPPDRLLVIHGMPTHYRGGHHEQERG